MDCWANLVRARTLRMPPSATSALLPVIRPRWPPHLHIKDREQFISGIPSTQIRSSPIAWRILQVDWRVWLVHSTGMDI